MSLAQKSDMPPMGSDDHMHDPAGSDFVGEPPVGSDDHMHDPAGSDFVGEPPMSLAQKSDMPSDMPPHEHDMPGSDDHYHDPAGSDFVGEPPVGSDDHMH